MIYQLLAINIFNGYMVFSDIKMKRIQEKVKEKLKQIVTNEAELAEILSK